MTRVSVCRSQEIPDLLKISRYQKIPELGPRILFFSGGTAINGLSKVVKNYTHHSIHLVTPFDSGGSSAILREAFDMPSIGDLRSRMMALADESILGHPEIYELFTYRMPKDLSRQQLCEQLDSMISGDSDRVAAISNPMRRLICNQLGYFRKAMPDDFDLRGASIGNLILTGGYLNNHKALDPIIFLFSKLVDVKGTVKAIVNDNLHLAADLEDGSQILGQHRITGKEVPAINSPIKRMHLSTERDRLRPASCKLRKKSRKLIESADLICYPPGSFYTSLLANLMPEGVSEAVAANGCPKVYVPNPAPDPEQFGMDGKQIIRRLLNALDADAGKKSHNGTLDFVLLDLKHGKYPNGLTPDMLNGLGIKAINTRLISKQSAPYYDNELLVSALLSLT